MRAATVEINWEHPRASLSLLDARMIVQSDRSLGGQHPGAHPWGQFETGLEMDERSASIPTTTPMA